MIQGHDVPNRFATANGSSAALPMMKRTSFSSAASQRRMRAESSAMSGESVFFGSDSHGCNVCARAHATIICALIYVAARNLITLSSCSYKSLFTIYQQSWIPMAIQSESLSSHPMCPTTQKQNFPVFYAAIIKLCLTFVKRRRRFQVTPHIHSGNAK